MPEHISIPIELLEQFERGNVLLFVAEGINQGILPSAADLARELAARCDYPPEELPTLPHVAANRVRSALPGAGCRRARHARGPRGAGRRAPYSGRIRGPGTGLTPSCAAGNGCGADQSHGHRAGD